MSISAGGFAEQRGADLRDGIARRRALFGLEAPSTRRAGSRPCREMLYERSGGRIVFGFVLLMIERRLDMAFDVDQIAKIVGERLPALFVRRLASRSHSSYLAHLPMHERVGARIAFRCPQMHARRPGKARQRRISQIRDSRACPPLREAVCRRGPRTGERLPVSLP